MTDVFEFSSGDQPLLISVPHDGRAIPAAMAARMSVAGRAIPDTDWHVAKLYDFATALGANVIVANYSRYVVDLNRPRADTNLYPGQLATGLCPLQTFAGDAIYASGSLEKNEADDRIARYWQPYHDKIDETLSAIRARHGCALLWDAHSIRSSVPRLFPGELPTLNLGSNDTASCARHIEQRVADALSCSDYSSVVNGRFKGGYITRHYGNPHGNTHALQLEIAQRAYMSEARLEYDATRAVLLRKTLRDLLQAFLAAVPGKSVQ